MRDPGDFKTLDRPVWHALTGRQARLAVATGAAVRIDPAYGPFAALRDGSDEAVVALRCALAGPDDAVGLVERERRAPTPGLQSLREATLVQMVATKPAPVEDDPCIVLLGEADAPEMTELALATEPGPWAPRRIATAISSASASTAAWRQWRASGCCFRSSPKSARSAPGPNFAGKASPPRSSIASCAASRRGDTPFLHTYADNVGAIRLYETLGFELRCEMALSVWALA